MNDGRFASYYRGALPDQFRVRPGDILLSWSGTPGTSFGCFIWRGPEGWLNQHIFKVNLTDEVIPEFFVHQVNSLMSELISRAHGGVGLQHVTKGMLQDLLLWMPVRAEQERIVKILDEAQALCQLRTNIDDRSDQIIVALFHEIFGDAVAADVISLKDLLCPIESGWSPVCLDQQASDDQWGVLKLSSVTSGHYLQDENKALQSDFSPRPSIEVKHGDILFSRKNTKELVGATVYVWDTRPKLMLSDLIFRLRPRNSQQLNPVYLAYALKDPHKRQEIQRLASGAAGSMPNISKERLLGIRLKVPKRDLQEEFAKRAEEVQRLRVAQSAAGKRLQQLAQALVHHAFEAEL